MTTPKDIIGIVKQLQKRHAKQEPDWAFISTQEGIFGNHGSGYRAIGVTGCGDGRTQGGKTANYVADLHNAFPSIAEALLIAVEALEKTVEAWNDGNGDETRKIASDALSRIHSL